MRVTIHQPIYLPYGGFFQKIIKTDIYIIFDNSAFKKTDYEQKNRIRIPKGWKYLIIPIDKKYEGKPINEVRFINNSFKKIHWNYIQQFYHNAPYFKYYEDDLKELFKNPTDKLADFNEAFIRYIIKKLEIKTKIIKSSELNIDFSLKGTDINLAMLKAVGATFYLSGASGINYLDLNKMKGSGIEVEFQNFKSIEYNQQFEGFVPNMSIIDLMFSVGPEAKKYLTMV